MPTVKNAQVDHKTAESLANDVLRLFGTYGNPAKAPASSEIERFFTPNVLITSNDRTVVKGINDFVTRIRNLQKMYSNISYSKLLTSPFVDGNKVAIRYNVDLTSASGKATQFQILALLTVEDGKIANWTDIVHEKGSGSFDNPSSALR